MVKKSIFAVIALAGFMLSAGSANAVTFSYYKDISNTAEISQTDEYTEIELTLTGGYRGICGCLNYGGKVNSTSSGLGVDNGVLDSGPIDGFFGNDVLYLEFSTEFQLNSFDFSDASDGEEFSLYTYNDGSWFKTGTYEIVNGFYLFTTILYADFYALVAEGSHDSYRLNEVIGTVSAVPLPPSMLLFGGALLGLGWVARKKKFNKSA